MAQAKVVINGDSKDAQKAIQDVTNENKKLKAGLDDIKKTAKLWSAAIIAGTVAVGYALKRVITSTADYADTIDKTSQRIGLSIEETQKWNFVTEQLGTNLSSLETGLGRLQRNVSDANIGLATAKRSFEELGVEVTKSDGSLRSMDDIFPEVVKKLGEMDDETRRNAMALELFGRGGQELIPILNAGADSIDKLMGKAKNLNLVMPEKDILSWVEFKDELHALTTEISAVTREFTNELLPVLKDEFLPFFKDELIPALRTAAGFVEKVLGVPFSWEGGQEARQAIEDMTELAKAEAKLRETEQAYAEWKEKSVGRIAAIDSTRELSKIKAEEQAFTDQIKSLNNKIIEIKETAAAEVLAAEQAIEQKRQSSIKAAQDTETQLETERVEQEKQLNEEWLQTMVKYVESAMKIKKQDLSNQLRNYRLEEMGLEEYTSYLKSAAEHTNKLWYELYNFEQQTPETKKLLEEVKDLFDQIYTKYRYSYKDLSDLRDKEADDWFESEIKKYEERERLALEEAEKERKRKEDEIKIEEERIASLENLNTNFYAKKQKEQLDSVDYTVWLLEQEKQGYLDSYKNLLGDTTEYYQKRTELEKFYNDLIFEIRNPEKTDKNIFESIDDELKGFVTDLEKITAPINSIYKTIFDNRRKEMQKTFDTQKKLEEKALQEEIERINRLAITEEEKEIRKRIATEESNNIILKLQETLDQKQRKLAHEEAKRAKSVAMYEAGINTALAITKALSTGSVLLAAIIGALGAAQIAAISQQPLPALAKGGTIVNPGSVLVGEQGPEILSLPRGATVTPLGKASGGNININITGNHIASDIDINRIGDKLVAKLKLAGVR